MKTKDQLTEDIKKNVSNEEDRIILLNIIELLDQQGHPMVLSRMDALFKMSPGRTHNMIKGRKGIGDMLAQRFAETLGVTLRELKGWPAASRAVTSSGHDFHEDADSYYYVPLAKAFLSAGGGALVLEEGVERERFAFRRPWMNSKISAPSKAFLMPVRGDSMYPTIQHGDVVLIDPGDTRVRDRRSIFGIRVDDMISVKRLVLLPHNVLRIISDNYDAANGQTDFPPVEVPAEDVHIFGRVAWLGRDM
ncbi:MAG: S24 family peptidase [Deltaproteobacteria bacterium]|nr:S24 family peptidase [Deltaproteobacteria bacterium]